MFTTISFLHFPSLEFSLFSLSWGRLCVCHGSKANGTGYESKVCFIINNITQFLCNQITMLDESEPSREMVGWTTKNERKNTESILRQSEWASGFNFQRRKKSFRYINFPFSSPRLKLNLWKFLATHLLPCPNKFSNEIRLLHKTIFLLYCQFCLFEEEWGGKWREIYGSQTKSERVFW